MEQPSQQSQLKRELKLPDLVLMQVLIVLGIPWIGYAAKQGSTHVVLWITAILFFYVPLAVVVMFLSRAIPVEGGMYQWSIFCSSLWSPSGCATQRSVHPCGCASPVWLDFSPPPCLSCSRSCLWCP